MRLAFCFSRNCSPYPTTLALRSLPCWPGAKLRFSMGHLSVKHVVPLRNSFIPSRRHRRHTASLYLAKLLLLYFIRVQFTGLAEPVFLDKISVWWSVATRTYSISR